MYGGVLSSLVPKNLRVRRANQAMMFGAEAEKRPKFTDEQQPASIDQRHQGLWGSGVFEAYWT